MYRPILIAALAALAAAPIFAQSNAEQVYKNITALKGTPADQLIPAMQFISASLGVECSACHVQGNPAADDKPMKKTARSMIEMTLALNKDHFGGRLQVSCNTCHNGHEHPNAIPPVLESDAPMKKEAPAARPSGPQPTADDVLQKYLAAVGGADALKKTTTRIEKGVILAGGMESPIELYLKAPNKRISISKMGNSDSMTAFDGTKGWMGSTGRPAREMSEAESAAAGLDAQFALALSLKELYPQLRRGRPDTVNGVECEVLQGTAPGKPLVRLYFDKQSGLLVRMQRYADTPVGRTPTQIDYADYRDSDGAKIPYRWTLSRPNGRFTIQIKEVQNNAPVDDAKFSKP
ncbi:MAG: c-type cytochrome [Acidobacteriia bacterium]|nr:c-type cytochrome [Terriglobia bacterium]